jgi:hypothetical protein
VEGTETPTDSVEDLQDVVDGQAVLLRQRWASVPFMQDPEAAFIYVQAKAGKMRAGVRNVDEASPEHHHALNSVRNDNPRTLGSLLRGKGDRELRTRRSIGENPA